MLNTLLTDTMSLSEKIEIWDKKFDFDMLSDDEERRSKIYVYAVVDADSKNFNNKIIREGVIKCKRYVILICCMNV